MPVAPDEKDEKVEGLLLKPDGGTTPSDPAAIDIELEVEEGDDQAVAPVAGAGQVGSAGASP